MNKNVKNGLSKINDAIVLKNWDYGRDPWGVVRKAIKAQPLTGGEARFLVGVLLITCYWAAFGFPLDFLFK